MEQGMTASNAVGEGSMGIVQGSVSPGYATNTVQLITLDTTGAQKSSNEGMKATFSAGLATFSPAANATDIFGIMGSNTKKIRVLRIAISGRATAAANIDVTNIKRSTLNTGGSPATITPIPHDSNDAAATAVVQSYVANPSALGTVVGTNGIVRAVQSNVSQAGSGGAASPFEHDFGWVNDKAIVLNNANEGFYFNLNGSTPAGCVLNLFVEWTEE